MSTLSQELPIISMAHALGIHQGDPVKGIRDFCCNKIRDLIAGCGSIHSIDELEKIVCDKLNTTIIEVWSDEDLAGLIEKYCRQERDFAFAALRDDLDAETFATLIRRKARPGEKEHHYVAVIDCRGEKAAKRFFTRWHEIAHVLTMFEQLQLPLHRSTVRKDPVEKMMDLIAGDIGFYDPMFVPVFEEEMMRSGGLNFSCVDAVRKRFCPTASLEATLNACVARFEFPLIVLQAEMGFKRDEERKMKSGQIELFPSPAPIAKLRVVSSMPNPAARRVGVSIHQKMRIPEASVIAKAFANNIEYEVMKVEENLNWWRSSEGKALRHEAVRIEAMRVRNRVWALITCTSRVPPKRYSMGSA